MIALLLILAAVLLALGAPFFLSLGASVATALYFHTPYDLNIVFHRMFGGIQVFALLAVPFFIFAAEVVVKGQMARRLVAFVMSMVGHFPGGLAVTTIVSCVFFGAVSGSTQATVAAIGGLMFPAMQKAGYSKRFILGLIVNSSDVALLIPPSIAMIIYGVVTSTSVGALFIGGVGPGIVMAISFMMYAIYHSRKLDIPTLERATMGKVGKSFVDTLPGLGIPVIIIGGIYGGFFTPTEAAAVVVVYSIFIEVLIYRSLSLPDVYRLAVRAASISGVIFLLVSTAQALTWLLTVSGVPQAITEVVASMAPSPIVFLMIVNLIFFLACMLIDPISVILIFMPILGPAAMKLGIHPVHLGILVVMNIAIGSATPPFGIDLFTAVSIFKVRFSEVVPGAIPFVAMAVVALIIVTYVPSITLFLPRLLLGLP